MNAHRGFMYVCPGCMYASCGHKFGFAICVSFS
jgi:hypothetical protein